MKISPYKLALATLCAVALIVILLRRDPLVEVANPVRGPAVQAVYATGTVEATVMMPLAPRSSARLMELNVEEGSEVKKDQVLARLEDEDLRQIFHQEEAREAFAAREFHRHRSLYQQNAASKQSYERALSDWEAAKAAVRAAQAKISYMTLVAPEDGRIIRRDGEPGQLISANQPVFWFSCCAPLRISAEVDEEDIALVQPGQRVLIRADAFPRQTFDGKVQSITPKGDPVARSYRVRIGVAAPNPLLIGMTAETNIIVRETPEALLVPTSAVLGDKIWLLQDGRLKLQNVTVGAVGVQQIEIAQGVGPDDIVVVDASVPLREGQQVRTSRARAVPPSTANFTGNP